MPNYFYYTNKCTLHTMNRRGRNIDKFILVYFMRIPSEKEKYMPTYLNTYCLSMLDYFDSF